MKHANVPYHGNPTNSYCALACYTMIGQYLLPEADISFEMFGELANYKPGYVVWAFPVWKWMLDHGISIYDTDVFELSVWANEGIEGLKVAVSKEEFDYYQKNTYDLGSLTEQVGLIADHPNFTHEAKKVTWQDIVNEFDKPGICDLTLNGKALARKTGLSVHRVVLLDISDDKVTFHNPRVDNGGAFQEETIEHFRTAVESLSGPEICRYWVH